LVYGAAASMIKTPDVNGTNDSVPKQNSDWVRLFWILRFSGYDGGFASAKAAYDSPFLLTSFSLAGRLRWDEAGAWGTVSGTR